MPLYNPQLISAGKSWPIATRALAIASNIPVVVNSIITSGYSTITDKGGATYTRGAGPYADGSSFQSNDGAWWLLTEETNNPFMFGAKGDGITDDTTPLQNMLNFNAQSSFIPGCAGFCFTSLTMPQRVFYTLYGCGQSSMLIQKGTGIKWPVIAGPSNFNSFQSIKNIAIDGTAGTGDSLNTAYCQTLEIDTIFFENTPVGFCSLVLDGNPTSNTYCHDTRVSNIRQYNASSNAAEAVIKLGAYLADCTIDNFVCNAFFTIDYCILASAGAQTTVITNSHPYNAKKNVVKVSSGCADIAFGDNTFDNALEDIVVLQGCIRTRWANNFIQLIPNGFSGIVLDASYNNTFDVTAFMATATGRVSCAKEINGSSGNKFNGGNVDDLSFFSYSFNLTGDGSYAKGFQGYGNYDSIYTLNGVAKAAQTQNTALAYGANGGNANAALEAWGVPLDGHFLKATVEVENTPAAGQTFTFNIKYNGSVVATGQITNGNYSVVITPVAPVIVSSGTQIYVESVFSATSGSATPRYGLVFNG